MIPMCSLDSCIISRHERMICLPVYRWRWKPAHEPHGHWRERHNAAAISVDSTCSDRMRHHGYMATIGKATTFKRQERLSAKVHSSKVVQPATNIAGLHTSLQTAVFSYSVVERVRWWCTTKPWPQTICMACDIKCIGSCLTTTKTTHRSNSRIVISVSCNTCSSPQCSCSKYDLTCTTCCKCMDRTMY